VESNDARQSERQTDFRKGAARSCSEVAGKAVPFPSQICLSEEDRENESLAQDWEGAAMNREYDIFESCSAGPVWRCSVVGREETMAALADIAKGTTNEVFAMYLPGQEVIARLNISAAATEIWDMRTRNPFQQAKAKTLPQRVD
jgi:hypothetical protein